MTPFATRSKNALTWPTVLFLFAAMNANTKIFIMSSFPAASRFPLFWLPDFAVLQDKMLLSCVVISIHNPSRSWMYNITNKNSYNGGRHVNYHADDCSSRNRRQRQPRSVGMIRRWRRKTAGNPRRWRRRWWIITTGTRPCASRRNWGGGWRYGTSRHGRYSMDWSWSSGWRNKDWRWSPLHGWYTGTSGRTLSRTSDRTLCGGGDAHRRDEQYHHNPIGHCGHPAGRGIEMSHCE